MSIGNEHLMLLSSLLNSGVISQEEHDERVSWINDIKNGHLKDHYMRRPLVYIGMGTPRMVKQLNLLFNFGIISQQEYDVRLSWINRVRVSLSIPKNPLSLKDTCSKSLELIINDVDSLSMHFPLIETKILVEVDRIELRDIDFSQVYLSFPETAQILLESLFGLKFKTFCIINCSSVEKLTELEYSKCKHRKSSKVVIQNSIATYNKHETMMLNLTTLTCHLRERLLTRIEFQKYRNLKFIRALDYSSSPRSNVEKLHHNICDLTKNLCICLSSSLLRLEHKCGVDFIKTLIISPKSHPLSGTNTEKLHCNLCHLANNHCICPNPGLMQLEYKTEA